jgi:hypothetical protein
LNITCCFFRRYLASQLPSAVACSVSDIYTHDKNWHNGVNQ